MSRPPLVAVVGATGVGKSEAAVAVAEAFDGEVVSADAYQLYRGLDIGTAKVSAALRERVRHHLIDIADPDAPLTLARYLDAAQAALADIWSRHRLPVLAGGSGQYVWALLEGWQPPRVPPDPELRRELEALAARAGPVALHARLAALDAEAARRLDPSNLRRVVRALEVVTRAGLPLAACQARRPLEAEVIIIGLRLPRDELYRRLDERTDAMFAAGLVEEVGRLRAAGLGDAQPLRSGVGYKEVSLYLDGAIDYAEAARRMKSANHRLVRRQGAWFKPDDRRIRWVDSGRAAAKECVEIVRAWLGR